MELELKHYVNIIWRKLWIIVLIVAAVTTATAIYSYYFMTPVYQASTKLIVNHSQDSYMASQYDYNMIRTNLTLIGTYKEIIKTPAIMEKVLERHPEFNVSPGELMNKVSASSVNDTQVMTVIVQDESHAHAVEYVNAISETFRDEIPNIFAIDNVMILNYAVDQSNPSPIEPNPTTNIIISVVVALMLGIGLIFLIEYLDDTLKTEQDIQRTLGLPTLATIVKINDGDMQPDAKSVRQRQAAKVGDESYVNINQ